ncbi:MAG: hypothetical protein AB7I68_15635 [Porticoccaceae bacterium]
MVQLLGLVDGLSAISAEASEMAPINVGGNSRQLPASLRSDLIGFD